ncbi:aldo/keto reductase [Allobacillus sp. GCM10007491]|uniref:Aldo/keto reductase n=2 Tax=Allobacillus TaxID=1400133 RepID=A0A941CU92_9BACI|nr:MULTISPECIES: aldo/keto reductase [Allobacillus]MBR7553319.1 aldo/keto reductase [Allobacillus saliphilus]TSJ67627.1 aldo/keto reductase [Allobacillus salarius]
MKKRRLGNSNLHVSEIGLGCMSLGTDVNRAKDIIHEAIQSGINYLDTADLYDFGENEKIVGQAIKGRRDDVVIATKGGNHFDKDKKDWFWDPSKTYLKEAVKNSLHRLGIDEIDLYQLHGGTIEDPFDEVLEALEEMQQEGLIRYYGISSIRPNVIQQFSDHSKIVSNMMQYSLLDRRPEEFEDILHDHEVSIMARGSLAKGMLTDDGMKKWEQKGQDGFLDYSGKELRHTIKELLALSKESGQPLQSLAMAYLFNNKALGSLVIGASEASQVEQNMKAYEQASISDELYEELRKITKSQRYESHRV